MLYKLRQWMQGSVEAGEYWVCDAEDADAIILPNLVALWKLRWRHANTMVRLFEEYKAHSPYYYFTAGGLGPVTTPWIEEYVEGRFVQYRHQPQEWVEIWQNVADKLLNKVREANAALKRNQELKE